MFRHIYRPLFQWGFTTSLFFSRRPAGSETFATILHGCFYISRLKSQPMAGACFFFTSGPAQTERVLHISRATPLSALVTCSVNALSLFTNFHRRTLHPQTFICESAGDFQRFLSRRQEPCLLQKVPLSDQIHRLELFQSSLEKNQSCDLSDFRTHHI